MYWVLLLLSLSWPILRGLETAIPKSHSSSRQLNCDVAQRGFHLNMHCLLNGPANCRWDTCVLKFRLSRAMYADPYELRSNHPGFNITFAKPRKSDTPPSRFGRFLSWFTGSDPHQTGYGSFDQFAESEESVNQSEIDIEAPDWTADPMTINVVPQSDDLRKANSLDVPLHLRYRLPNDGDRDTYLEHTAVPHPMLKCTDGDDFNSWDNMPPFEVAVPSPPTSDLLLVMPVTILFLTVGVLVLLFA
ncbi:unnamed protein product [Dicrocoelium dendriticum]|nr:unnamed protein product [Dicrocoelium dendriticum]